MTLLSAFCYRARLLHIWPLGQAAAEGTNMQDIMTIDQRRAQLEQLWLDDRREFLTEYCRVVGQPANDPTMSLKAIINHMIDGEVAAGAANAPKPR
jgi:hypothetical protein